MNEHVIRATDDFGEKLAGCIEHLVIRICPETADAPASVVRPIVERINATKKRVSVDVSGVQALGPAWIKVFRKVIDKKIEILFIDPSAVVEGQVRAIGAYE